MATETFDTVGIMFHTADGFPTLEQVGRTNYVNLYSLDIPEEILGWSAIAANPRRLVYADHDQEAMDDTNWDVIVGEFDDLPTIRDQMGTTTNRFCWHTVGVDEALEVRCALIDGILIVASDHPALEEMCNLSRRLADYLLLDEDAYSEREYAAWQEYAPTAFRNEINYSDRGKMLSEEDSEFLLDNADDVLSLLANHLHYSYGFSGEYGPDFLAILETMGGVAGLIAPGGPMGPEPMSVAVPLPFDL